MAVGTMRWAVGIATMILLYASRSTAELVAEDIQLITPSVILEQVSFAATIHLSALKNGSVYPRRLSFTIEDSEGVVLKNGTFETLDTKGNFQSQLDYVVKHIELPRYGNHEFTTIVTEVAANANVTTWFMASTSNEVLVYPGWISLLPPLVTLIMSAVLNQVLIALVAGIWCGATIIAHGDPFTGFLRTFDKYWVDAFTNDDHAGVLLFTIVLGGTIGVVQKGGGGHGLALLAKEYMTTSLRMQVSTWLLCLLIFFDDYSCILIIGSSLRNVLSETGVSREKFAAIIHTLGVCLPSMAPVSSWIGVEIGYVAAQIRDLKLDWDPFVTCLSCIHYRFFPILFVGFIFITILCEKDFGPMVQYEKDAAASPVITEAMTPVELGPCASPRPELGPVEPDTTKPLRWQNAVIPFGCIIVLTFLGMIYDGYTRLEEQDPDESYGILDALSNCNSVAALIRASAAGWVLAVIMLLLQGIVTLDEASKAWIEGVKDILDPTLILILAWALGTVIGEVNVAPYIASVVGGQVPKEFLPAISSVLCFIVSFAIGSSFGTMAIMFPIIAPLSWSISGGDHMNLMQCFGSILGSSVFGNTCSPIADTSILAALSANVPLKNHVRSIMPYALLVAVVSVIGGSLPIGLHIASTFTAFGVSLAVLLLVVFFCGTRVNSRFRALSSSSFLSASPPSKYTPIIFPIWTNFRRDTLSFAKLGQLMMTEPGNGDGGSNEAMELTSTSNPYLDFYRKFCETRQQDLISVFDPSVDEEKRAEMYAALDVSVAMKYSWAIPDERALRIIKHYGPIVEMGAGTGYWGRLLQLRGVDIICYDIHTANDEDDDDQQQQQQEAADRGSDSDKEEEEKESEGSDEEEEPLGGDESEEVEQSDDEEVEVEQIYWMDVQKGTPKDLRKHSDRALFLCYPDDFEHSHESMALQSLYNYDGDTVIHVGELFGQTVCLPGPWGRTSSQEFQTHLASVYHKVLQVPLPSWHSSIDTLTVWRRTKTSIMDNSIYAFIPAEERLDLVAACPSTRHLLEVSDTSTTNQTKLADQNATVIASNGAATIRAKSKTRSADGNESTELIGTRTSTNKRHKKQHKQS